MALPVLLGATLPSVDDCSRSAPPAPTQRRLECLGMGGWLPSESPAGISRNDRLECVGLRALHLAAGQRGRGFADHGAALHAVGVDRLARDRLDGATRIGGLI